MFVALLPLVLLAATAGPAAGQLQGLNSSQVLRVFLSGQNSADLLRSYEDTPGVDFWTELYDEARSVDVMVSPDIRQRLTDRLISSGATYSVRIADVQEAIAVENPAPSLALRNLQANQGYNLTWKRYHRLADHHAYLDTIAATYPHRCKTFSIGKSFEGRDLKGIKCGTGDEEIWIDGGIHAREWISPAVVSYLVRAFAESSESNKDVLEKYTVYFVPILNPDGYEYSHGSSDIRTRLWRKTRSVNPGSDCIGTDGNRNFGVGFGGPSTSSNPCSDVYHGPEAFSEPETRAVRDFLLSHADKMKMYLSFHSYSQLILLPYGYAEGAKPDDLEELERVGNIASKKIRRSYGRKFKVIPSVDLYPAGGTSHDWTKKVAGIKYSYTFELRDTGRHGFLLPAKQILPSAREMVGGIRAMIKAMMDSAA